jgi:NADH:ubiquinone oxidoreductase subunit 6 (subunit J)
MASEERRAWTMLVVTVVAYVGYVAVVLSRSGSGTGFADTPYRAAMLWSIGAAIVASIALDIAGSVVWRDGAGRKDQRDREIARVGDHVGQALLVTGAVAALLMALAEWQPFWIANVIYLGFVLSSVLGSATRVAAYRWGFTGW